MIGPEFFPTPARIIHQMLAKISNDAEHFLEPSAGRGDIAQAIKERGYDRRSRNVDCIESSPDLISVLLGKDFPVVGFDWLTYTGVCYYDAIVMNPPFSNGEDHLLRAWDFMHNGEIVCLLNEETIKNPHTAARQRLATIIANHGEIEYLGDCFATGAARRTGARVAMIYLKKAGEDDRIDLWATASEERKPDEGIGADPNMLAIRDNLGNMQHYYDAANEHMLKAFQHIRKAALYMGANDLSPSTSDYAHILPLALSNINSARAEFIRKHRHDAWVHVFDKMQFHKWLDKKQRDEFLRDIELSGNIPFTADNIKGTLENVFTQRKRLFEKSVTNVFDELTRYFKGNTNHVEGWKSNDIHKVNKKLVFPWGCEFDRKFGDVFNLRWRGDIDIYADLDRVLCVLDGEDFESVLGIGGALQHAFETLKRIKYGQIPCARTEPERDAVKQKCSSRYFDIRFFKKGTVHLVWKRLDLWEKFNTTAAAGRRWIGCDTKGNVA